MTVLTRRALYVLAALSLIAASVHADPAPQPETARVVKAANDFLATLDAKQRTGVSYAYDDEKQRTRWSNLPTRMTPRGGLSMGELSEPQRSAAMALVSSALSSGGSRRSSRSWRRMKS